MPGFHRHPALTDPRSPLLRHLPQRLLSMRASVDGNFLWSAVCSGCPNWEIDRLTYSEYKRWIRSHIAHHKRWGLVVAR